MRDAVETVHVNADLENYIATLVHATRVDRRVAVGSSPRGSLAFLKIARANAAIRTGISSRLTTSSVMPCPGAGSSCDPAARILDVAPGHRRCYPRYAREDAGAGGEVTLTPEPLFYGRGE
jgi:hypothetical protein